MWYNKINEKNKKGDIMNGKFGVAIKWLAVTSFEMRFGNTTVVSDPYITECAGTDLDYTAVENCDIISLGHAHYDHITDIPRLIEKFNPKILCGELTAMPLAKWLNCPASKIYPVCPNLELDFGDVKIKALFGRHKLQGKGYNDMTEYLENLDICKTDEKMADLQGVGSLEYRNFLFTTPNGTKILLWGNDATVEQINMCKVLKPDIAILQRATNQNMREEMAEFIKQIGCKVVIPHHHDFKQVDDPSVIQEFKDAVKKVTPEVEFISPVHGEWIYL